MEGSVTDPPPLYMSGAPCFTAGCREHILVFQYLERRPGIYSCATHITPKACKTLNLLHIRCDIKECKNCALYRIQLKSMISVPVYAWLCESCVQIQGGTFDGMDIIAINRPI